MRSENIVLRHQDQGTYVMKTVRIAELTEKEQWEVVIYYE